MSEQNTTMTAMDANSCPLRRDHSTTSANEIFNSPSFHGSSHQAPASSTIAPMQLVTNITAKDEAMEHDTIPFTTTTHSSKDRRLINSVIVRGKERVIDQHETVMGGPAVEVEKMNVVGEYPMTRKQIVEEVVERRYVVPSEESEWTEVTISDEEEATEEIEGILRRIPLPVEQVTAIEFWLPKMRINYDSVEIPLYVPKFIEVPYPADLIDEKTEDHANHFRKHIDNFASAKSASLCEVENVAAAITVSEFSKMLASSNIPKAAESAWKKGKLRINHASYEQVLKQPFTKLHAA